MGAKGVYLIQYDDDDLTVRVGGKRLPMEEFLRAHAPTQVTSLTNVAPISMTQRFVALLIAEEKPEPDKEWSTF